MWFTFWTKIQNKSCFIRKVVVVLKCQEKSWFLSVFLFVCFLGYTPAGTPYKVPPTQSNGAPPPYTPTPTPYPTAMYPIRSAYPQQNIYAQVRKPETSSSCCTPSPVSHDQVSAASLVCFIFPPIINNLLKQFEQSDTKWSAIWATFSAQEVFQFSKLLLTEKWSVHLFSSPFRWCLICWMSFF